MSRLTDRIKAVRDRRDEATHKLTVAKKAVVRYRTLRSKRAAKLHHLKDKYRAHRGPARAVDFLADHSGWHEDSGRPNRAAWLDKWSQEIGAWMVGQPWCGLAVWKAAQAAGVTLDKTTVSTVAIRSMAQRGVGGFKAWHPATVAPQIGWVAIYGTASSGPVHTGMYGGAGIVWEGNTSPGTSGSQNNGGGLYPRKLAERRGWLLGWAEIDWKD